MAKIIFILSCGIAFLAPFAGSKGPPSTTPDPGRGEFPTEFEGRPLRDLGLSERERYFLNEFPGQIGRFSDGSREIIIRRVTEATRKLHPASDCFRAIGYAVTPGPLRSDKLGRRWSTFSAVKNGERFMVYERIEDTRGREWTDASSWYWDVWGEEEIESWAWTVAEHN